MSRPDSRQPDELRPVQFLPGIAPHATGSVLISCGDTRVICSAMVEKGVPRWMRQQKVKGGWLTAEYNMLPYSTLSRKARDISRGKLDGRSSEIQRLIGRSLRAVVDLSKIGERTVWVDCDVLQADGGTRTASITGACVACAIAFESLLADASIVENPMSQKVAAVSMGVYNGNPVLDLNYIEDRDASVDFNLVMTEGLEYVEVQGSGEEATYSQVEMDAMLELGRTGISRLAELQDQAIEAARSPAGTADLSALAAQFGKNK